MTFPKKLVGEIETMPNGIVRFRARFGNSRYEYFYDAARDGKPKCISNIELSQQVFAEGTNIENEEIFAFIEYVDGSFQFAKIENTNFRNLPPHKKGIYTLRWKDFWGEYEALIMIEDRI